MHAIPLDDPLVQAYMDEIAAKIVEEKVSGAGYLDCFNFRNDLRTGQRTLIGCGFFSLVCLAVRLNPIAKMLRAELPAAYWVRSLARLCFFHY